MPGIQMGVSQAPTFSQIADSFSMDKGGKDHNIRFSEGQGLYTSDKVSTASFKAFFGFKDQLNARMEKRERGVEQIKDAIDRQYNTPGLGARVLAHINDTRHVDLSGGIKRSHLDMIESAISEVRTPQRTAAARDPDLGTLAEGGNIKPDVLCRFFDNHFDVCSGVEFWSHPRARQNADNFGCALSMAVLQRIQTNGEVTAKDLQDLHRVLGPYVGEGASPVPPPPDRLRGPLTEENRRELTQLVFDRYMKSGAEFQINFEGTTHGKDVRAAFNNPETTGTQRLEMMQTAMSKALSSQYMGPDNYWQPLRNVTT